MKHHQQIFYRDRKSQERVYGYCRSMGEMALAEMCAVDRVTRLGEFSPIEKLLTLGSYWEIAYFGQFF
jgi:hypothetical protein